MEDTTPKHQRSELDNVAFVRQATQQNPRPVDFPGSAVVPPFQAPSRTTADPKRGDFDSDILPGGGVLPGLGTREGFAAGGGNWMGPNHAIFAGQRGVQPADGSFGGDMHPRFDPFGPPGTVPPGVHPRDPSRFRTGPIQPNPDHLQPPNNLGGDMFM